MPKFQNTVNVFCFGKLQKMEQVSVEINMSVKLRASASTTVAVLKRTRTVSHGARIVQDNDTKS